MGPYKEDYIDDLLGYLAGAGSLVQRPAGPGARDVRGGQADPRRQQRAAGHPEGRRALLLEVVRVTSAANYQMLSDNEPWRLHMALVATLGSTAQGRGAHEDRRGPGGRAGDVAGLDGGDVRLPGNADRLRMRDPARTVEHLQLAGGLLVQALALRNTQVRAATGGRGGQPAPAGRRG